MKQLKHIHEADNIGGMMFDLQNFEQLPVTASKQQQKEALQLDLQWIRNHSSDVERRLQALISDIDEE